jgi:hypothetical protein
MAYFNGYQPAYAPNTGFQAIPNYQQQRMDYLQSMQQAIQPQIMPHPGELQARIVASREEAVAAQVLPDGRPFMFYCPSQQAVYMKRFDPQTNLAEFADFGRIQPQQPTQAAQVEYVPLDRFTRLEARMDGIEAMLTTPQTRAKGADAE